MKHIYIIGAVVLAAAVGGYFFISNPQSPELGSQTSESASEQSEQTESAPGKFTGSFFDLASRGGEWKCTLDAVANTGAGQAVSSGVVYVSGENVRGNFTTAVPSYGTVEGYMISNGTDVYTWSSMLPQGFKTKVTTASGSGSGSTSGGGMDANQSYSYDCQPTTIDASLFVPPASVTFQTI